MVRGMIAISPVPAASTTMWIMFFAYTTMMIAWITFARMIKSTNPFWFLKFRAVSTIMVPIEKEIPLIIISLGIFLGSHRRNPKNIGTAKDRRNIFTKPKK